MTRDEILEELRRFHIEPSTLYDVSNSDLLQLLVCHRTLRIYQNTLQGHFGVEEFSWQTGLARKGYDGTAEEAFAALYRSALLAARNND
jgi:hypothetical protein